MSDTRGMNPVIGYTLCSLMSVCGCFLIYGVTESHNMEFSANWNMFDSILIWPLYIIGLVVMFANWNKFSFSQDTYIKTTYSDGSSKTEKSYDISDVLFGRLMLPLLGRFVIVPLLVSAAIYYPLQCVIALVGAIFPWIVSLIIVGIIAGIWIWNHNESKNPIIFSAASLLLTICFGVGAYFLWPDSSSKYDYTPGIENHSTSGTEEGGDNWKEDIDESQYE